MAHNISVWLFDRPGPVPRSKYKFTEVQARHWEDFAQAAGLSWAQTKKRVLCMAQALPAAAHQLQALPPYAGQPVVANIVALLERR